MYITVQGGKNFTVTFFTTRTVDSPMKLPDGNIPKPYRKVLILLFWLPYVVLFYAVMGAAAYVIVERARTGEPVPVAAYLPVDPSVAGMVLIAAFVGVLWFIARYTFGGRHIDEAVDAAIETRDKVSDEDDDEK